MRPLIIEGPDGIGKTTLVQKIQGLLQKTSISVQSHHLHRNDVVGFQTVPALAEHLSTKLGEHRLWDRFHLGPVVYGWMCGLHQTPFRSRHDVAHYFELTRSWNAFTVMIFSSEDSWYADHATRLTEERAELFNAGQMVGANRGYQQLASAEESVADLYIDIGAGNFDQINPVHVLHQAGWI